MPELKITHRNLPHWQMEGSTYFITYNSISEKLTYDERAIVYEHILDGNNRFYHLLCAVVMPDHAHLILSPLEKYNLSRVLKGIKGVSAHLINNHRGRNGSVWQDESYDRIIRNEIELEQKINYIVFNPVRAELVADPEDYPFLYFNSEWFSDG